MSRQFVEMTKARIEGLLAAFPKLMTGGRQHTFVETESVRYIITILLQLHFGYKGIPIVIVFVLLDMCTNL